VSGESADRADTVDAAAQGLRRFVVFFQSLQPASLEGLNEIYSADAHFQDPFNAVQGLAGIRVIFEDMFVRCQAPRFVITSAMRQEQQAFVGWDFAFARPARGSARQVLRVQGCSHLHFDTAGLCCRHRDYWDAAGELYEKLPGLGLPMRWLRRRLSASGTRR
jgi:hypothetical protein